MNHDSSIICIFAVSINIILRRWTKKWKKNLAVRAFFPIFALGLWLCHSPRHCGNEKERYACL